MKQFRAIVTGRVQGVCYRAETVAAARALGCRGYARNLPDGRVEVVAAGDSDALDKLLRFLHHGPPLARVTSVEVDWSDTTAIGPKFEIRW